MIFPKRDVAELDKIRNITPLTHFIEDFVLQRDADSHPFDEIEKRRRGHYHIFTLETILNLIEWCNQNLGLNWKIEEIEETDSKIGNGHTVVARYLGPLSLREYQLCVASSTLSNIQEDPIGETTAASELETLRFELSSIKSTYSWQMLQRWWRFGLWLLPLYSRRRRIYTKLRGKIFD